MGPILTNFPFELAPYIGRISVRFPPGIITSAFAFPILRFYGYFKKHFPESSPPMIHISWHFHFFEIDPQAVWFLSEFRLLQLRGLSAFPILRFTELLKSISQIHHFRWAHFGEFPIFELAPLSVGFLSYFSPTTIPRNFCVPNVTILRNFPDEIFPRIITSDEPRFGNSHFRARTHSGRISVRFRPLQLRGISAFPILRFYGTFWKVFSRIITSDEPHFRDFPF